MSPFRRGFDIGLIGLDGVGKSTIATELQRALVERGIPTLVQSWRRAVKESDDRFVRSLLAEIHAGSHRMIWGSAQRSAGDVRALFPEGAVDVVGHEFIQTLKAIDVTRNDCRALCAAGWLELAADLALQLQEVQPRLTAGQSVILDSFGLKPVAKLLTVSAIVAREDGDNDSVELINRNLRLILDVYGSWLRPEAGFLIDASAETAWRHRERDPKGIGLVEDLAVAGRRGRAPFVELQNAINEIYREAVTAWGWLTIPVGEESLPRATERAVSAILEDLRRRSLI